MNCFSHHFSRIIISLIRLMTNLSILSNLTVTLLCSLIIYNIRVFLKHIQRVNFCCHMNYWAYINWELEVNSLLLFDLRSYIKQSKSNLWSLFFSCVALCILITFFYSIKQLHFHLKYWPLIFHKLFYEIVRDRSCTKLNLFFFFK